MATRRTSAPRIVPGVSRLPAIVGYTYWSYSVLKGKVTADAGYH